MRGGFLGAAAAVDIGAECRVWVDGTVASVWYGEIPESQFSVFPAQSLQAPQLLPPASVAETVVGPVGAEGSRIRSTLSVVARRRLSSGHEKTSDVACVRFAGPID